MKQQEVRNVGIDFGTSNTAAAIALPHRGGATEVLTLDPSGLNPQLLRSVLFFPDGCADVHVGAEAIASYAMDEEGRFVQSVKSHLPSTLFSRTLIRGRGYTLPALVAELLRPVRERIENALGGKVDNVVFGRPALFSTNPQVDALAQSRLSEAAQLAGFPAPSFVIEPIAAALRYEEGLTQEELVLVADFGAGTSDFTLIRLGPNRVGRQNRQADVLASTGVYVGGDNFDAAIVEHALLKHFGQGSTYLNFGKPTDLPAWVVRKMTRWHELAFLRDAKTMAFLHNALLTSSDPDGLQNFISLLEENLGYNLFQAVEACKRALSHEDQAKLSFAKGDIELEVVLRREEFEGWIAPLLQQIENAVSQVLGAAKGAHVDAIFLTGGSSQIPAVAQLFVDRFGAARLRSADSFTSVVSGLGRACAGLGG